MIYRPEVKGDFGILLNFLAKQVPISLAVINDNQNTFIALGNLIGFLALCALHADASEKLFLVSDQQDMSTADLLRKLGVTIESPAKLIRFLRVY